LAFTFSDVNSNFIPGTFGYDKYGDPKYAIYVPKSIHDEKIKGLLEKEVIVIVILPPDD
jgi:hypothetical protein